MSGQSLTSYLTHRLVMLVGMYHCCNLFLYSVKSNFKYLFFSVIMGLTENIHIKKAESQQCNTYS